MTTGMTLLTPNALIIENKNLKNRLELSKAMLNKLIERIPKTLIGEVIKL